jgi:hypothetical protein
MYTNHGWWTSWIKKKNMDKFVPSTRWQYIAPTAGKLENGEALICQPDGPGPIKGLQAFGLSQSPFSAVDYQIRSDRMNTAALCRENTYRISEIIHACTPSRKLVPARMKSCTHEVDRTRWHLIRPVDAAGDLSSHSTEKNRAQYNSWPRKTSGSLPANGPFGPWFRVYRKFPFGAHTCCTKSKRV